MEKNGTMQSRGKQNYRIDKLLIFVRDFQLIIVTLNKKIYEFSRLIDVLFNRSFQSNRIRLSPTLPSIWGKVVATTRSPTCPTSSDTD